MALDMAKLPELWNIMGKIIVAEKFCCAIRWYLSSIASCEITAQWNFVRHPVPRHIFLKKQTSDNLMVKSQINLYQYILGLT